MTIKLDSHDGQYGSKSADIKPKLAAFIILYPYIFRTTKKVSDTLEQVSNQSSITSIEKQKIKQLTQKSDRILNAVEQELNLETEKLFKEETEK